MTSVEKQELANLNLLDKVALVTGAGRGLGKAIALALASHGADVAILSRTEKEIQQTTLEIRALQRKVVAIRADVSEPRQVNHAVRRTIEALGTIDILVNNAGVIGPIGRVEEVSINDWITTIHVNLVGTFLCSRAVLPYLKRKAHGKIINIAGSGEGSLPSFTAYASSKSAIVRFTETLAEEVRRHNIDVNAVAPGGIYTRMTEEIILAEESAGDKERLRVRRVKESGGVKLEVAAELVAFLASDDSDGLTGKLISAVHDDWRDFKSFRKLMDTTDIFTMRRIDIDLPKRLRLPKLERWWS
jgi:3-oxoacyl-[acyl-carrier protein] reductase